MNKREESGVAPSRRAVIAGGLLAGFAMMAGGCASDSATAKPEGAAASARGKAFRLAHLTDVHVEPGPLKSEQGFTLALNSLHTQLDRKPDLIITGGDHVMDA